MSQARRLGLTLTEIRHIVALRRSGSAPCVHIRALLQQKVADLEGMLAGVRSILNSWRSADGRLAAVCPHIEAKGGDTQWKDSRSAPVIDGDTVQIGEDENTVVLKKAEWNVLVDAIQSGRLGHV